MTLYRSRNIPIRQHDIVFRQSRWHWAFAAVFMLAFGTVLLPFFRRDSFAFYGGTAIVLIVVLGFGWNFIRTLRPSNWILRCNEDGLIINFSSYLNDGSDEDVVAVGLRFAEIAWVAKTVVHSETPSRHDPGATTSLDFTYLDIKPKCPDLSQLEEALLQEWDRPPKRWAKARDHSVQTAKDNVIRMEWRGPSTRVTPSVDRALALLSQSVPVLPEALRQNRESNPGSTN